MLDGRSCDHGGRWLSGTSGRTSWFLDRSLPMLELRIHEASDGVCTVFIGHQVIVAGLSRIEASELVEAYHRLAQAH